jgi:hypothetical protein
MGKIITMRPPVYQAQKYLVYQTSTISNKTMIIQDCLTGVKNVQRYNRKYLDSKISCVVA